MLAFGERLEAMRQTRGLSQEDLAARAGLKAPIVSYLETGKRMAHLEHIVALADALDLDPGKLVPARFRRLLEQASPGRSLNHGAPGD